MQIRTNCLAIKFKSAAIMILIRLLSPSIPTKPEDDEALRERLIRWAQKSTEGYSNITVVDLTSSWRDGLVFNAILHRNR
jgi:dystonin